MSEVRTRVVPGRLPVAYPELWSAPPRGPVLVLAPHQDDETFGCGGAILLHRAQGDPVSVHFVTKGDRGDPNGHYSGEDYVALRETEARKACRILGVEEVEFYGLPDGFFEARENLVLPLSKRIREAVEAARPGTVYYPWIGEAHPDHFAVASAVERVAAGLSGVAFLGYELWSACLPSAVLDVSAVFARKVEAARVYASQLRYTDYVPVGIGLMTYRSLYLKNRGATHGEAFVQFEPPARAPRRSFLARMLGGRG